MTTSIDAVVRRYGGGISTDDFATHLEALMQSRVAPNHRGFIDHDRAVHIAGGIPAADIDVAPDTDHTIERAATSVLTIALESITTEQVAQRLGRSVSRIRGAIADHSLYGVRIGRRQMLP